MHPTESAGLYASWLVEEEVCLPKTVETAQLLRQETTHFPSSKVGDPGGKITVHAGMLGLPAVYLSLNLTL